MDTRSLGYLGLGVLVAVIVVTLMGVPPAVWITVAVIAVAVAVGAAFVVRKAQADGVDVAGRIMALHASESEAEPGPPASATPSPAAPGEVELVRAADDNTGASAVWLHRAGGRRVHRFESADGWVVQQVSTKDPDNPRKRVIGEPLTFATESEALRAAQDLAHGVRPMTAEARIAPANLVTEPSV